MSLYAALFDRELRFEMCLEMCGDEGFEEEASEEEASNKISEREAEQRFDDFLNEVFPTISICGYDYDPAQALKQCDPTAYREEFNNWLDGEGLELE